LALSLAQQLHLPELQSQFPNLKPFSYTKLIYFPFSFQKFSQMKLLSSILSALCPEAFTGKKSVILLQTFASLFDSSLSA